MSLVPTYVQAVDGKFYKNPTVRAPNNEAFLCFDDDDPPEIVMKGDWDPVEVCARLGCKVKLLRKRHGPDCSRCFAAAKRSGRYKPLDMAPAWAYFVKLLEPITIPAGMTGVDVPKPSCTVIAFGEQAKMLGQVYPKPDKK